MDPLERLTHLVRAQRAALLAVARGEGMSPEEALECVQEALLTFLMREEDQASEHAPFTLRAMVRNQARNARRKHARLKHHEALQHELAAQDPDVETLLLQAEQVVRLRLCVARLCDIQRAVVTLRLLDERSGEDVASELGVSRSYVDVLVHRARASLHVCMRAG